MSKTLSPFTEEDIKEVRERVSTPCHLYSEVGLRETCKSLIAAFSWCKGYSNFFAVKANPNPYLLNIMKEAGFGCDCSSMAELILAESCGFIGDNIMFSSNNTPISEFKKAKELGAIINLDDISHIEYINERIGLPDMLSFRYNPGPLRTGNKIIGDPIEAKFGLTRDQILPAYTKAKQLGVTKFFYTLPFFLLFLYVYVFYLFVCVFGCYCLFCIYIYIYIVVYIYIIIIIKGLEYMQWLYLTALIHLSLP
eukprot:GHVR01156125.1.p1 GENE.GHVR01156125.1~~GHVR01156125.1.p1  ORF type:complete len:252 (+),score=43.31 GHVR01156125.1:35-790(+)